MQSSSRVFCVDGPFGFETEIQVQKLRHPVDGGAPDYYITAKSRLKGSGIDIAHNSLLLPESMAKELTKKLISAFRDDEQKLALTVNQ